ncbi:MAG: glycosyltransferase family 4 protein [Gammaproteobacteria bacterium]|nr:glycosyltransferase family 4 protein [Gammaproteobacteria bacterium]
MRVLFISHYFPPEEPPAAFLAFEFAKALRQSGHVVDVLTGYPNWPRGQVFQGYSRFKKTTESMAGITVHRLPFLASPTGSFIRRALDFKSFQILAKWFGKQLSRPDLIYVLVPPNEDGIAARYLARHFKCPYVLNVQDLHPDTSINLGFVKNPVLIDVLKKQAQRMFSDSEHVVAIGPALRQRLIQQGRADQQVSVLPNWIDTRTVTPLNRLNQLRTEWNIREDVFVVLYAGTFGRIHGTTILSEVASDLIDHDVLLLLVGQGYDFDILEKQVADQNIQNILVKPFVPRSRLSELQALADLSIVLTKSGFGLTSVPSKVLGYMAASRPVLAAVDQESDTASLLREANSGMIVEPENQKQIVEAIIKAKDSPDQIQQLGENGRNYILKNLTPEIVLAKGVALLESITENYQKQSN